MRARSRVTIDIDAKGWGWELAAIRAYYNLRAALDEVEVRASSGGGVHLVGKTRAHLDDEAVERLRATFGDDPRRLRMDVERGTPGHPTQVLWTDKGYRAGSADRDFADVFDALEYIEQRERDDADRVRAVANKGHKALTELSGPPHLKQAGGL